MEMKPSLDRSASHLQGYVSYDMRLKYPADELRTALWLNGPLSFGLLATAVCIPSDFNIRDLLSRMLCSPCSEVFTGIQKLYVPAVWHATPASLEAGLALGCPLCHRVLSNIRRAGISDISDLCDFSDISRLRRTDYPWSSGENDPISRAFCSRRLDPEEYMLPLEPEDEHVSLYRLYVSFRRRDPLGAGPGVSNSLDVCLKFCLPHRKISFVL